MKQILLFTIFLTMCINTSMAQKEIKLEDIWASNTFDARTIPGFNFMKDGRQYTLQKNNEIIAYDITTGEKTQTIFDPIQVNGDVLFQGQLSNYIFSEDETLILLATKREQVYRRSYFADYIIYNREKRTLEPLYEKGKQMNAHFSPDGKKIGFVFENNLYYKNLEDGSIVQVTSDGEKNAVINGAADWVYEEEFAITRTFEWSPDSRYLAYIRFDEKEVREFTMTNYKGHLYPDYETFKYPKVGEKNSEVEVYIYDTQNKSKQNVDIQTREKDLYIPRIKWMNNQANLTVFVLNRHQNDLKLWIADPLTGKTRLLMQEQNQYYIDIHDDLTFLADGEHFLWMSEKEGYNQVYLCDMEGDCNKIVEGEFDITELYGYDPVRKQIYFQAAKRSPLQREVFAVRTDGTGLRELSKQEGWNTARFSTTYDYFILTHSTANTPPTYAVLENDGRKIRILQDNKELKERIEAYNFQPKEFFTFKNREGTELNGYMIRPVDFDPNKQYPVFMFLYGGPGSQQVVDSWGGRYLVWFQMLAQQGYLVACVDNRGTGARGEEFKKQIYLNLGKYETADQIDAAKYLGSLDYTDEKRIGVFGWSYGGYMSTNLILHGNDVFKLAIAVAPVTHWRWYDTIYTERYMRTESENKKGYHDYSPVYFANKLKGHYLLVHGMSDDNVHLQHSTEMADALIRAGKDFETMYYPNDAHSINEPGSRLHLFRLMTQFLNKNL